MQSVHVCTSYIFSSPNIVATNGTASYHWQLAASSPPADGTYDLLALMQGKMNQTQWRSLLLDVFLTFLLPQITIAAHHLMLP
jgi:hypothetical protein